MSTNSVRDERGTADFEADDTGSDSDAELTRDDLFHILQCRRRRLVLKFLHEHEEEGPASMSEIAEHIAAFEHGTTVDALRSQQRQRVYIPLYQFHLPKMDEAGVIDYDQDRGCVETTRLTDDFDAYLDGEPSLLADGSSPGTGPEADTTDAGACEPAESGD